MKAYKPDPNRFLEPQAVVCTMTASDVGSINEDRSEEWCQDFIFENGEAIHDAMVRAAFAAIETLSYEEVA